MNHEETNMTTANLWVDFTSTRCLYTARVNAGLAFDAYYDAEQAYLAAKDAWDAAFEAYRILAGLPKISG